MKTQTILDEFGEKFVSYVEDKHTPDVKVGVVHEHASVMCSWLKEKLEQAEQDTVGKLRQEFPIWKMNNPLGLTDKDHGWNMAVDYANAKVVHIINSLKEEKV